MKKAGNIYIPQQYITAIREAKTTGNPNKVTELNYSDFYDLKQLYSDMELNISKDTEGALFQISQVRQIKFEKGADVFYYKKSFDDTESWYSVPFCRTRRDRHTRRTVSLKQAYTKPIPFTTRKKEDLQSLFQANLIPQAYKPFYDTFF